MKFEYINPFVKSLIRVLDEVIQSDVSKGKISLVGYNEIHGDIVIVIKVEGDSEGSIVMNMDHETALNVCNVMMQEEYKEMTPLCMDAISELANMIVGNATSLLVDLGHHLRIAPPLIVARDGIIKMISDLEVFQVPLFTDCGEITMNAVLRTQ